MKLKLEIELEIGEHNDSKSVPMKDIVTGIVLVQDDVIDGYNLTTSIAGCDPTTDFYIGDAKIVKKEVDLTGFEFAGCNREEAYQGHLEYEAGFSPDCQSIMDFETFCNELDLGYGNSDCIQVARLYEAPDGKIWYDTEYYG